MSRVVPYILPAYVLLCLVLGGSAQAIWGNALLELLAIALIAWAVLDPARLPLAPAGRSLLALAAAAFAIVALQLVPLPPALWSALPGRGFVAEGFALLGAPLPWLPLSLAPADTLDAAVTLLPPLAILAQLLFRRDWDRDALLAAVVAGAALGVLLGLLQVSENGDRWYFYAITNLGVPTGTFANANHFASLLLCAVPLLAALAAPRLRGGRKGLRGLTLVVLMLAAGLLAVGMATSGSASLLLIGPAVAATSALLLFRVDARRARIALPVVGGLVLAAAALVVVAGDRLPSLGTSASIDSRGEFWSRTGLIVRDHGVTGTGFGTFRAMYQRYEDPARVDRFFVNHAHNDYLELAADGGLPAVAVILLFLLWWSRRAAAAWLGSDMGEVGRAAAVASGALLLHSTFDYPLRTIALMAVMALCLGLMAGARGRSAGDGEEEEKPRHATL